MNKINDIVRELGISFKNNYFFINNNYIILIYKPEYFFL